jgi:hypothetical protein
MMEAVHSSETSFLQEPCGITSQKKTFFDTMLLTSSSIHAGWFGALRIVRGKDRLWELRISARIPRFNFVFCFFSCVCFHNCNSVIEDRSSNFGRHLIGDMNNESLRYYCASHWCDHVMYSACILYGWMAGWLTIKLLLALASTVILTIRQPSALFSMLSLFLRLWSYRRMKSDIYSCPVTGRGSL